MAAVSKTKFPAFGSVSGSLQLEQVVPFSYKVWHLEQYSIGVITSILCNYHTIGTILLQVDFSFPTKIAVRFSHCYFLLIFFFYFFMQVDLLHLGIWILVLTFRT